MNHADGDPARYLLGRIAGIDEKKLRPLVAAGAAAEITERLQKEGRVRWVIPESIRKRAEMRQTKTEALPSGS
jgi:hypothetical protein